MFSMCSELAPRAHIPDTRIPQLMQPCSESFNNLLFKNMSLHRCIRFSLYLSLSLSLYLSLHSVFQKIYDLGVLRPDGSVTSLLLTQETEGQEQGYTKGVYGPKKSCNFR